ncbi:MAG: hypothetical protein JSV56_02520 [Methanomassiliicoccales archaeon]|nr:MAG: hypothetical protein JSV56_02520 [Methanomassiliicoccales archaeon]
MTLVVSMPRFHKNEEGVEGIPLKLIIVLVILAITIPITWKGVESYDRSQTESNLRSELDYLSAHIKQVYLNGIGNALDVEVDFRNGMMTRIEKVEIGDSTEGIWSSIRYKLSHKGTEFIIIKNPNIPIGNVSKGEIGPLITNAGKHTIHLECKSGFDFDDDGADDIYVEISRGV